MEKRVCILMGSPRENGNTATLLKPMVNELTLNGFTIEYLKVNNFQIEGCLECLACQKSFKKPNCSIHDEMEEIFEAILKANCLIIATPIFTWFCTPKLKAIMDRLFSCSKKYNESNQEVLLLKDKVVALVTTCGYKIEEGSDLMEVAIRRLADYSGMKYCGHLSIRDVDGISDFEKECVVERAIEFANSLVEEINEEDSFSKKDFMEDSSVKLRKTMEDDIEYVLMTERDAENEPFVGQWEEATHKATLINNDVKHLIIEDYQGNKIGYVILAGFTNKNNTIELKRITISAKGKGYGKAAIELVKKYVLLNLGFHRLWLDVRDKNLRARHVYKSAGFTEEGILREAVAYKGNFENLIIMSILENEVLMTERDVPL